MGLRKRKEPAEDKVKVRKSWRQELKKYNQDRERRKREKERRKRRTYKYGQAKLKHSKRGLVSSGLAFTSTFLMMLIFSVSYISRGEVNILIGFTGLGVIAMSILGLEQGIKGLKEREKNYISCKGGILCNGILLLIFTATYIRGFFR